jgi:hypothetical protein
MKTTFQRESLRPRGRSDAVKHFRMPLLEEFSQFFERMDSVNQFLDFEERGEHALVDLNPYFTLMPIEMRVVTSSVHAVYCGNNLYTHVLLHVNTVSDVPHHEQIGHPNHGRE